jgi:hypothetical protein
MNIMRFLSLLFLLLGLAVAAGQPLFEVLPPEKAAFNYPPPPREGAAEFFPIAQDGVAKCVIIRPAQASTAAQAAARSLQSYLNLATGARIQVVADDKAAPADLAAIHVGDTTAGLKTDLGLPELHYGGARFPNLRGYLVKTLDRRTLVIRGVDEAATNHAIVGFLKRYAGVRQYWPGAPGAIGDVVPRRASLTLPQTEWRDWPCFLSTAMSKQPFGTRPALDFYRTGQTLRCGENYVQWLPPSKHAQAHPEYYPLIDGKRRIPKDSDGAKGWQPCVSNPEVAAVMAQAVTEHFRAHPGLAGINVAINDGGGDCTCADCRAMDAPGTNYSTREGMSERYVKFTNRICELVGREFPEKWIVYLAYAAAEGAPQHTKPHPKLLPVLTTRGNNYAHWDNWMRAGADQMGLYLHHNDTFFILPKLDIHQMARRIRYVLASGRARVFYMETHTQWPFGDMIPFITSEMLWDPRQNVDALLSDYFTGFYGPAAEAMRSYYTTLEAGYERWLAEEGEPHSFGKDLSSSRYSRELEQFRVLTPDEAARAANALAQAARLAADDAQVAERIRIITAQFQLQELAVRWAWAGFRLRDAAPQSQDDVRRIIEDARSIHAASAAMRRHIEDTLEQPPFAKLSLFQKSTRGLALYDLFKSGDPGPEMSASIAAGLQAAGDHLRQSLGPERAAAWWREVKETETQPELAIAFEAAAARAEGKEPKNLLTDPGFEDLGRQIGPTEFDVERDVVLTMEQSQRVGMHYWFPDRSPFRCVIAESAVHSGRKSLMIEHCHRARYSRSVSIEPGGRYRAGMWFRQDEGEGRYRLSVAARLKDGSYPELATINIPAKPGAWREIAAEVVAPADATTLLVRLYIDRQSAGARCWVDDVFISQ